MSSSSADSSGNARTLGWKMTTEVTAKVRRIAPVQSFRGIAGDLFTRVDSSCCLGAKTFVYGRNGTGKTTFAELLRQADEGSVAITAEYFNDGSWRKGALPATVVSRIHVFNRYYVDQQLRIFLDGSGSSAGILKLGQINVEAETTRRELEQEIKRQGARLAAVTSTQATLSTRVKELKHAAKQRAIDVLGQVLPLKYGTRTFTVINADKALLASSGTTLTDEQRTVCQDLMRSPTFELVSPPRDPLGAACALRDEVAEVVARELNSRIRPDLARDRALADWIEAGLNLHPAGDDKCKFCTVGTLPAEIRAAYEAHFDTSLTRLRSDLRRLQEEIDATNQALANWRDNLHASELLLPDHRAAYEEVCAGLKDSLDAWIDFLVSLSDLVTRRADDPHHPLLEPVPPTPAPIELAGMTRVIAAHNSDVSRQASLREQAEKNLLEHLIEPFRSEYVTALRRIPLADRTGRRIAGRIDRLQRAVDQSRDQQHDVGRMAELINDDLANNLGHVHLSLRVTDDGKGYRVLRSNGPASDLSEGERNSLALLYFLRSLEADGVTPEHDLVVIDDPVTSLDKDSMFASYSLVDERTKHFGQLVVLTHDYELFRLFLMRYRKALNASRREVNERKNKEEAKFPRVQFLETRAHDLPSGERGIALRLMPERLLTQPTDYHYIFHRIAEAVRLRDDTDLPLLGNAARRLLEGFVAFKSPSGGDFQSKIEHAAHQAGVSTELTQRIVRFVHGASHRDEPNPSVTFDSANVPDELSQVLRFIRSCDTQHFKGMCKAVDVDLADMIGKWDRQTHIEAAATRSSGSSERLPEHTLETRSKSDDEAKGTRRPEPPDTLPL
jgi:wobble nucleotide-excising tRNase